MAKKAKKAKKAKSESEEDCEEDPQGRQEEEVTFASKKIAGGLMPARP